MTDLELFVGLVETVGLPVATTPVTGTTVGTSAYVFGTPLDYGGTATRLRLYALATGAVRLTAWSKSGDDFTLENEAVIAVTGTGVQDIDITGTFDAEAGQYIGVQGNTVFPFTVATGDSGGYYDSGASFSGTTFTDAAVTTTARLQIGIDFARLDSASYIERRIQELLPAKRGIFTLGKTGAPVTASAAADRVYVMPKPVPRGGILYRLRVFALGDGAVRVRKFTKSGDDFTQTGEIVFAVTSGLNSLISEEAFTVEAGEYVGLYTTPGILPVGTTGPERWWTGYYDNAAAGGGDDATFTDTAAAFLGSIEVGFDFLDYDETKRDELLNLLMSPLAPAGSEPDWSATDPTGFVLLWLLGESGMAGRAPVKSSLTFDAGKAYKYVRSSTDLQTLADPTGNDATALASGGKGSMGPAFAHTLRQLSRGRLGAIIVNSGEGGTTIGIGWASGGAAWTQAVTDLGNALADAATKGLSVVGCAVAMDLGVNDAIAGTSEPSFESGFTNLKARVDTAIGSKVPFFIVRTGAPSTGDTTAFQAIRAAQDNLTETEAGVFMAHSAAVDASGRGLMIDTYHFALQQLEEMGEAVAQAALAHAVGLRPLGYAG